MARLDCNLTLPDASSGPRCARRREIGDARARYDSPRPRGRRGTEVASSLVSIGANEAARARAPTLRASPGPPRSSAGLGRPSTCGSHSPAPSAIEKTASSSSRPLRPTPDPAGTKKRNRCPARRSPTPAISLRPSTARVGGDPETHGDQGMTPAREGAPASASRRRGARSPQNTTSS